MRHEHKFDSDLVTYQNGLRYTEKRFCACGAMQRVIHDEDRYGPRAKHVLVTEPNGRVWESHAHRHATAQ